MPDIRPLRGLLYNPQKIKDIAQVVTEPYDVISPQQQMAYYRSHPYNMIRLILGKQKKDDTCGNNQYTRARDFFMDWQKRKILVRDGKENIYIYTQTFFHNHQKKTRTGFIALLKLEDFAKNAILPHENTFSQPVQDRLKLLKAVRANLSPIFALFCDQQGKINKLLSQYKRSHRPHIDIKKDNIHHSLWRMSRKREITAIKKLLKGQKIFIADGHHRYEAALNYKMQMQRKKDKVQNKASFNYIMTYLTATTDRGLTILPTHRVVKINRGSKTIQKVLQNLKKVFQMQKFSASDELFSYLRQNCSRCIFGSYFGPNKFYGLKLKNSRNISSVSSASENLDVAVLHNLIIEYFFNLSPSEENIYYTRDAQEAIKLVDENKYQVAFFLRPATVTQVEEVAKAGQRMPHKSTYFYPKLLSGLVINKF